MILPDDPLWGPPFALAEEDKTPLLLDGLNALTEWHRERCPAYARYLAATGMTLMAESLADLPWLPVGVFKSHDLRSIPDAEVFRVLASSGTTGQQFSRIAIDREAAALQTRALSAVIGALAGPRRLPMLIIDAAATAGRGAAFNARTAGVLGMMTFGRGHAFALTDDMQPALSAITAFLDKHGGEPFLMFGFTFVVWAQFLHALAGRGLDFGQGLLIHSGGWKKLHDQAVDNAAFKSALRDGLNLRRVHNFYGMVEQIGSIFLEDENGFLHCPAFAEVIIRDPATWEPAEAGQTGVIQVLSILPRSYPGHSILTEDLGAWYPEETGSGWRGRRLRVQGRIPRAELRGCGDVGGGR
jgi:hypothetical protein